MLNGAQHSICDHCLSSELITLFRVFVLFCNFSIASEPIFPHSILRIRLGLFWSVLPFFQPSAYHGRCKWMHKKRWFAPDHRVHIKWIQFQFIFSICFECPRDIYEWIFSKHNSLLEMNVRFVCITVTTIMKRKISIRMVVSLSFNV